MRKKKKMFQRVEKILHDFCLRPLDTVSLMAGLNSHHQLNLFLMQPLCHFSQKLKFLPDWLNRLTLQSQQEALSKSLTLLTAPFCSFTFLSIWFWNRHQGQMLTTDTITSAHQQFILQLYLCLYTVLKSPVIPKNFWVIVFQPAFPQIELVINDWVQTLKWILCE